MRWEGRVQSTNGEMQCADARTLARKPKCADRRSRNWDPNCLGSLILARLPCLALPPVASIRRKRHETQAPPSATK